MAAKKKTQEELEYDLLLSNLRDLLKMKAGQKIIWHILSLCGIYTDSFSGNSQTFYLEGKRAIGLEILMLMEEADPTMYARLLLDNQKLKEAQK